MIRKKPAKQVEVKKKKVEENSRPAVAPEGEDQDFLSQKTLSMHGNEPDAIEQGQAAAATPRAPVNDILCGSCLHRFGKECKNTGEYTGCWCHRCVGWSQNICPECYAEMMGWEYPECYQHAPRPTYSTSRSIPCRSIE
jgi:hypothetical protein